MNRYSADSLKVGDFLLIHSDIYVGYLGKGKTSLESYIGKVLPVVVVDKPNNKIILEAPGGSTLDIPFKDWKTVAMKFDKVKESNWRRILGVVAIESNNN